MDKVENSMVKSSQDIIDEMEKTIRHAKIDKQGELVEFLQGELDVFVAKINKAIEEKRGETYVDEDGYPYAAI